MKTDRELLKDALDALEEVRMVETRDYWDLMDEIRARLAEPEDEPVGYLFDIDTYCDHRPERDCLAKTINPNIPRDKIKNVRPVYTHPPKPTGLDQLLERNDER